MPTYIGFSTIDVNQVRNLARPGVDGGTGGILASPRLVRKFRLVDEQLVIRDLLNAFSIKQGEKVGQPAYGSTLWNNVYEPNTSETRDAIESEVRRIAGLDPRLQLNTVAVYYQDNGVLIEIEMSVTPFNNVVQTGFLLNRYDGTVSQLAA